MSWRNSNIRVKLIGNRVRCKVRVHNDIFGTHVPDVLKLPHGEGPLFVCSHIELNEDSWDQEILALGDLNPEAHEFEWRGIEVHVSIGGANNVLDR